MNPGALLSAEKISKTFTENGVVANDRASLRVESGRVHAVVGENGAGKSTLMHIIAGAIAPDAGRIVLRGREVAFAGSGEALDAGIVISFQHPRLVETLTVWENLVLGAEPVTRFGILERRMSRREILRKTGGAYGLDLNDRLNRLSSGQARLVSLLAAILRLPDDKPGILILDEPTAACSPHEAEQITAAMCETARAGHGVIFITHKLDELDSVADCVTVMRDGRDIACLDAPFSTSVIATHIFAGADAAVQPPEPAGAGITGGQGETVFGVSGVTLRDDDAILLSDVSFTCKAGEILGLTGSRQSGIEAIEEVLGGIRRPDEGSVSLNGVELTGLSSHRLRKSGVGYVPTDRLLRGASLGASVAENLIVLERKQLQRAGVFVQSAVQDYGERIARQFDIDGTLHGPLNRLSGGNIQKVILGRELALNPKLLVICEPGWGLDVRSQVLIVERIRAAAADGAAVVVISTDMDEVLELADSIGAFYGGRLSPIVKSSAISRDELGKLVFGSPAAEGADDGR